MMPTNDGLARQRSTAHVKHLARPRRLRVGLARAFASLVAAVVVVLLPRFVDAQSCARHFGDDELLARLDTHLARCVDAHEHHETLEIVKDRFATNEYARQQPLAMALFSNSTPLLHAFTGAIASALFGDAPASPSVQVLDFAQLLEQHRDGDTNYDVKNAVRRALSASLSACPERNLFIMENVHVLDDATLPVLDTFLDPMNGVRAHFQQHSGGGATKLLDCTNAVFLFHFHVSTAFDPHSPPQAWRDFLMTKWTRKIGLVEEFTPQAFVGRLTEGVALFARDTAHDNARQRPRVCLAHQPIAQTEQEDAAGSSLWAFIQSQRLLLCIVLAFVLLHRTKLFTRNRALKHARHTAEPIVGTPLFAIRGRDNEIDDLFASNGRHAPPILELAAAATDAATGEASEAQEQRSETVGARRRAASAAKGAKSPKAKKSGRAKGTRMQLRSKKPKRG